MTMTNWPRPIVLMDQPDDMSCEDRGWVSIDADVGAARDLLTPFCQDESGNPARPAGEPKRVWLAPENPGDSIDAQRWKPCDPDAALGVEFWEFDATDTEALASAETGGLDA